ncbi:MAG: deoxyribodipyrimidine photolyase [Bacteroides sp. SM23_62_1]|nr:MAG: deoxyribodipyrimidine photolyase [Bacteroides sp. SM23_62_1]
MNIVDPTRIRILKQGHHKKGPVLYWMSRDQRVNDNWALLFAQQLSEASRETLLVAFTLSSTFLGATFRHYAFMMKGLKEVSQNLAHHNIPFSILPGDPPEVLIRFIKEHNITQLVTDFDPLRPKITWKTILRENLQIPFFEVDAHNIIPCFYVSSKQEFGAYTLRPKIKRELDKYCIEYPQLKNNKNNSYSVDEIRWDELFKKLHIDRTVGEVDWIEPGEEAANKTFADFVDNRLGKYSEGRNDPNLNVLSNLSPYLHFGHISAQRIALELITKYEKDQNVRDFLEELIIRRELSDNYCFYNPDYDTLGRIPAWSKKTLDEHRKDEREFTYTTDEFERAHTHDHLWNAVQKEMLITGKMHGYMRMYWAKKILEWTASPDEALRIAIYLNNKYELDGRDPNGYTGCAWSIGGVHDRPWNERPVYGKIRFMSNAGCKRKFDVDRYIARWTDI